MEWFWWISGVAVGLAWLVRGLDGAIGTPRIANLARPEWDRESAGLPRLAVVVPARNEEKDVGAALESLARMEYEDYCVVAVDDRSTDRTGEIMEEVAGRSAGRVKVLHVTELPAGWLGKTHAMWRGAQAAESGWILFTDADVVFRADALRRAVAYAEERKLDHLVAFPRIEMRSFGERMMVALFQAMSLFLVRVWKVRDPKAKDAAGMGAFNLVRRSAYEAIGTFASLRMEVVEDLMIGVRLKRSGFRSDVAFGLELMSLRWVVGTMGIVNNLTKNFFAIFHFRWELALAGVGFCLAMNALPFVGVWLAPGWAKAGHATALAVIFGMYLTLTLMSSIRPWHFVAHPVGALLLSYSIVRSAFFTTRQGGVVWRGTKYDLAELRKGMVR